MWSVGLFESGQICDEHITLCHANCRNHCITLRLRVLQNTHEIDTYILFLAQAKNLQITHVNCSHCGSALTSWEMKGEGLEPCTAWRKMQCNEGPKWLQLLPTRHLAIFNNSQLLVDLKRDPSKAEQKVQTFSLAFVAWNQSFQNGLNHGRLTFHGRLVFLAPWQQFGAITTQEDRRRVAFINFYNS